ncbi:Sulfotransferase (sult) [Halocaridina rubra]|uniref:Sulfotransferase (Sult) n=1 Tax=Halocaridina rubra TaxID=373956 RepID=A0AAN8XB00_HALRR
MYINLKAFLTKLTPDNPLYEYEQAFKRDVPEGNASEGIYIQTAQALRDSRTLKTHYPFSLLHPTFLDTAKVVYISRNPRDTLVSFYHMMCLLQHFSYKGNLDEFVDDVINGRSRCKFVCILSAEFKSGSKLYCSL